MKAFPPTHVFPASRFNENHDPHSGEFSSDGGSSGENPKTAAMREKLKAQAEAAHAKNESTKAELAKVQSEYAQTAHAQIAQHASDLENEKGNLESAKQELDSHIASVEKKGGSEDDIKAAYAKFSGKVHAHGEALKKIGAGLHATKEALKSSIEGTE